MTDALAELRRSRSFEHANSVLARDARLEQLADNLPRLTEHDLQTLGQADEVCPICLNPFHALLAEEEMALAMDSPAHPIEELGITRLKESCGHIFCRRDIRNWMREGHETCPTCRCPFLPSDPGDDNALPPSVEDPSYIDMSQFSVPRNMREIALAWMGSISRPTDGSGDRSDHESNGDENGEREEFAGVYS
ncbi:hypothetical protein WOLCODRAFT_23834 [Wolfiporia cocos MD-104 SS10]|uniref:RING-type domain-containing protein n=1 Tax=Wolfiporia cocos (strain MD-104) TaxID=742152 RepID=A0A2H3JDX7_WOLCO|nr:hypothetical protein WOLCODRAFT_23834 [Wolfiporia cocos MD-104 SS10]